MQKLQRVIVVAVVSCFVFNRSYATVGEFNNLLHEKSMSAAHPEVYKAVQEEISALATAAKDGVVSVAYKLIATEPGQKVVKKLNESAAAQAAEQATLAATEAAPKAILPATQAPVVVPVSPVAPNSVGPVTQQPKLSFFAKYKKAILVSTVVVVAGAILYKLVTSRKSKTQDSH